jgi:hypothetical protein
MQIRYAEITMRSNIKLTTIADTQPKALSRSEFSSNGTLWLYTGLTVFLFLALLLSMPAQAQYYGDQRAAVTVYEDCDFRGNSRTLDVGDYSDVRRIRIGNDKISSIRVNRGYTVRLFQDERFRGISKVFSFDEPCLGEGWNDQASSLVVDYDDRRRDNGRYGDRDYDRDRDYDDRSRDNGRDRDYDRGRDYGNDRGRGPGYNQGRGPDNDRGRGPVSAKPKPIIDRTPDFGVINGSCFNYKAYARGGEGGIKFQQKGIKQKFNDNVVSGKVCHQGSLELELNKMDKNVAVFVEINGRTYKFASGEKEDLLLNAWYRKMIKLSVRP